MSHNQRVLSISGSLGVFSVVKIGFVFIETIPQNTAVYIISFYNSGYPYSERCAALGPPGGQYFSPLRIATAVRCLRSEAHGEWESVATEMW